MAEQKSVKNKEAKTFQIKSDMFRSLTPQQGIDIQGYREALDYAFSNDDIRNIAISGSYGSGKSSVFNTYANCVENKDKRKFIRISLARFEEQGKESKKAETPEDMQKTVHVLEGKILNQLLHQIPPSNIYQSNFRIKREITPRKSRLTVAAFLVFVVSLLFFFLFNRWTTFVGTLEDTFILPILKFMTNPYVRLFWGILALVLLCIGLYRFVRTHNFQNIFKKIDVNGVVGIELFEKENSDSFFDKYLNEVIYLFEHSDADAIVFEDLDRYDVTLIFEKLREINDLIHQKRSSPPKKNQKVLRFVYLIRDDIFSSSDRSKFFDFIIPIVPITDCSNSANKLMARLNEAGFEKMFSKRFLQDVSLYLSDLRLINNIVNELLIYHARLLESSPSDKTDCQFAMILYKNLFPQDYILLQQGRGYVHAILEKKKTLIRTNQHRLSDKISELRSEIIATETEHLQKLDELNALYFPLNAEVSTINNTAVDAKIGRIELIKQILSNPDQVFYRQGYNTVKMDVSSKQSAMENDVDYSSRKSILNRKASAEKNRISNEVQKLEQERKQIDSMTLKELIQQKELGLSSKTEDDFWTCTLPEYEPSNYVAEILGSPWFGLLKYLIRNGYINENYSVFVSYLHPGSLSPHDREFLLSLHDRKHLGNDYLLDNPGEVLEHLSMADFGRRELCNFCLLDHLLKENQTEKIKSWIQTLTSTGFNTNELFDFLLSFWRSTQEFERFIRFINHEYPHWFQRWTESGLLTIDEWRSYAINSIYYAEGKTLERLNEDGWLTARISEDEMFLQIDTTEIKKLINGLQKLEVRFPAITCRDKDLALMDAVYQNGLYQITFSMLNTIMTRYYDCYDEDIEQRSYTFLLDSPEEPLTKYVEQNMPAYMAAILGNGTYRFTDDEPAVVALLNHKSVSEEDKLSYISRLDTKVQSLTAIETLSLWQALLKKGCVEFTWDNIANYFVELSDTEDGLTAELSAFMEQCEQIPKLPYDDLKERIGTECTSRMLAAILRNTDISLPQYDKVLDSLGIHYSNFTLDSIPTNYIVSLLKKKIIRMTAKNAENMRSNYPDCFADFVALTDTKAFADLVEKGEFVLTQDELTSLLLDSRISEDFKVRLLDTSPVTVSLASGEFSAVLKVRVIEDHFDTDDIESLLESYDREEVPVQTAIKQYAEENWENIYPIAIDMGYIPAELYANCLSAMDLAQAEILRGYLDDSKYEDVCVSRKNPSFRDTDYNRTILKFFKKQGWISSWQPNGNGSVRAYSKQH